MPRVSVITGYYNRAHALEKTINSILEQSFTDLELIVFDDCSTDGTAERLHALSDLKRDPRLKLRIHETNTGFVQGMIDAIAATDSEYIAVQGSGDVSLPRRLEKQVERLDAAPEFTATGCWYTNVIEGEGLRRDRRPSEDDAVESALLKSNIYSHGEVTMRRTAYDQVGGYRNQFRYCQDYDLWLRLVKIGPLAVIPELLYDRYVRFDGVSYSPDKIGLQTQYKVLAQTLASTPELNLPPLHDFDINALVSINTPEVQMALLKACLRSEIFGGRDEARAIMRTSLTSGHRWAAEMALNPPANWALHAMMPVVVKSLKIKKGH